jgi:membrane-associated protease RseP (regulator of RpoE activity)
MAETGALVGDRIISLDGEKLDSIGSLRKLLRRGIKNGISDHRLRLERNGKILQITVGEEFLALVGKQTLMVDALLEHEAFANGDNGIRPGDRLLAINGEELYSVAQLNALVRLGGNNLRLLRNGAPMDVFSVGKKIGGSSNYLVRSDGKNLLLVPSEKDEVVIVRHSEIAAIDSGSRISGKIENVLRQLREEHSISVGGEGGGKIFLSAKSSIAELKAKESILLGVRFRGIMAKSYILPHRRLWDILSSSLKHLWNAMNAKDSSFIQHIEGPIGVTSTVYSISDNGKLLELFAMLNISLFMLNLLPIPILDGGKIALLLLEIAIGRSLPLALKIVIFNLCFLLLLLLSLYVSANDILRLSATIGNS